MIAPVYKIQNTKPSSSVACSSVVDQPLFDDFLIAALVRDFILHTEFWLLNVDSSFESF